MMALMAPRSDLSRRQFLARSAGFAGASLGLGVCGQDRAGLGAPGSPGREMRLGFLGVGDRGTQLLATALRVPGVRIVALSDVDPAHLRRAADLARDHKPRLASPEMLLGMEEAEAIFIASPVFLHRQHAVAALRAGKHVYLEKPL